jgi:phage tail-like protein
MAITGMRQTPIPSFSFYIELDHVLSGSFRECSGLGSESEVIEDKETKDHGQFVIRKVPGRLKWTNISLKRGITTNMDIWDWRKKVEEGNVDDARMNGSIMMYDQDGTAVARWDFKDGWPSKVSGPSMNAQNNEIGIEELEIVHEGLVRVDPRR